MWFVGKIAHPNTKVGEKSQAGLCLLKILLQSAYSQGYSEQVAMLTCWYTVSAWGSDSRIRDVFRAVKVSEAQSQSVQQQCGKQMSCNGQRLLPKKSNHNNGTLAF